jgi:hypothetical protein
MVSSTPNENIIMIVLTTILITQTLFLIILSMIDASKSRERIKNAEVKVNDEPEKAKPAWDLARITLEAYFSKNLSQITAIFFLCVVVMTSGFVIIIWGITQAVTNPSGVPVAIITACAGVVTEFIGATFLYIYKSTIQQAATHTKTLERINSVGMAMQILDTIPDDASKTLKNETKAMLVRKLMDQASGIQSAADEETKPVNK